MPHRDQDRARPVTCLTGFIRRAEPIGFIQRGNFRLVDTNGNLIAILRSRRVNLNDFVDLFARVCGIDEGEIEGVRSLLVLEVRPVTPPPPPPPPPPVRIICLAGFVRRAEPIGIIQRGTHRLVDVNGNVIASLRSDQVNLFNLEGRFVIVCGIDEGFIEGVRSILVTQVFPISQPTPAPQIDLRTLLLLLLLLGGGPGGVR